MVGLRMPELAEVEYYKRRWAPAVGATIRAVRLNRRNRVFRGTDPGSLERHLPGRDFRAADARGKQMAFRFGSDGWLGIHLGMAGRLLRERRKEYPRHKHDHLVLETDSEVLVFRDTRYFGRIRWHEGADPPPWWTGAGPDLLSPAYTRTVLERTLRRRPRTPVKSLLLDQAHFPGLGNWMADEILWRAEIHPATLPGDLDDAAVKRLYRRIREVCRDAIRVIAPDWSPPPSSWLFPHRWKDGGTCPKTGRPLERIRIAGRTACFSPARQQAPASHDRKAPDYRKPTAAAG